MYLRACDWMVSGVARFTRLCTGLSSDHPEIRRQDSGSPAPAMDPQVGHRVGQAVQPEGRFGAIGLGINDRVDHFMEKPQGDGAWINGGFFVCEPDVFKYISIGDNTIWERAPLEAMAKDGELFAYKHSGFWKPMDMLRDKMQLEDLWNSGNAPWKCWE